MHAKEGCTRLSGNPVLIYPGAICGVSRSLWNDGNPWRGRPNAAHVKAPFCL